MSTSQQQIEELINDGLGVEEILSISIKKGIPKQIVLQAIESYISDYADGAPDRSPNARRANAIAGEMGGKGHSLTENQSYKWRDGFTLSVDWSGKPTEAGWKSFGYINGWDKAAAEEFKNKVKDEKPYTINLSMHKEAVYYPKARAWYEVDSSG